MKVLTGIVSAVLGCAVVAAPAAAASSDKLPAAARYYPLVGHWKGEGELASPGQPAVKLALKLSCYKVSSGWAVRCAMSARNGKMVMTESDLFGVDPVTGQGHWYAITNQGETHDHLTKWTDARTMKAQHGWQQGGKQMMEHIVLKLPAKRTLEFRSVVTADGQQAGAFSGRLAR